MSELNPNFIRDAFAESWLFLTAGMVFWMQVGFALLEVGSIRAFHLRDCMIKNVLDFAVCIGCWFAVGFALSSSSGNPFIGTEYWFLDGAAEDSLMLVNCFWALSFASSAVTIVSGAVLERCRLIAYIVYSAVMSSLVYPLAAHWVWSENGWLSCYSQSQTFAGSLGYMDFAGSSIVHGIGGTAALVAVVILGARQGRFSSTGKVVELPGLVVNSLVYKATGILILVIAFTAFNASSVGTVDRFSLVGLIAMNTLICSASGALAVAALTFSQHVDVPLIHCLDGLVAGAVSSCAGAALMQPWAAMLVGIGAGMLFELVSLAMLRLQVDDVVNAVAVHLPTGLWGVIAIGFFGDRGLIERAYSAQGREFDVGVFNGGSGKQLGVQVLGALCVVMWTAIVLIPLFLGLHASKLLRMSADQEMSALTQEQLLINAAYSMLPSGMLPSGNKWPYPTAGPGSLPQGGPIFQQAPGQGAPPLFQQAQGQGFQAGPGRALLQPKPPMSPPRNMNYPQMQPASVPTNSHTLAIGPSNSSHIPNYV